MGKPLSPRTMLKTVHKSFSCRPLKKKNPQMSLTSARQNTITSTLNKRWKRWERHRKGGRADLFPMGWCSISRKCNPHNCALCPEAQTKTQPSTVSFSFQKAVSPQHRVVNFLLWMTDLSGQFSCRSCLCARRRNDPRNNHCSWTL